MVSVYSTDAPFLSIMNEVVPECWMNNSVDGVAPCHPVNIKPNSILDILDKHSKKISNSMPPNDPSGFYNLYPKFDEHVIKNLNENFMTLFWPERWTLNDVPHTGAFRNYSFNLILDPYRLKNQTTSLQLGNKWYRLISLDGNLYLHDWTLGIEVAKITSIAVASNGVIYFIDRQLFDYNKYPQHIFGGTPQIGVVKQDYPLIYDHKFDNISNYKYLEA